MDTLESVKQERGFTLVELLISVVIIAVAFAGLATMQIACINGNSIAGNLTTGITLAQDKLEELKSLDYNHPSLSDVNTGNDASLDDSSNYDYRETDIDGRGQPGGKYTRIINIADDSPIVNRKTVVVIVSWKGHTVRASSIIGAPYS